MTVFTWIMSASLLIELIIMSLLGEGPEVDSLVMFGVLSVAALIITIHYFKSIRTRTDAAAVND